MIIICAQRKTASFFDVHPAAQNIKLIIILCLFCLSTQNNSKPIQTLKSLSPSQFLWSSHYIFLFSRKTYLFLSYIGFISPLRIRRRRSSWRYIYPLSSHEDEKEWAFEIKNSNQCKGFWWMEIKEKKEHNDSNKYIFSLSLFHQPIPWFRLLLNDVTLHVCKMKQRDWRKCPSLPLVVKEEFFYKH